MVNATTVDAAQNRVRKRPSNYKPREGAAPRWPGTPYRWAYLQARMVELNMQPKDLSDKLSLDVNRIYEWLNGTQIPRPNNLRKLSRALQTTLPQLLASLPIQE